MKRPELNFILKSFVGWRIALFGILFLAIKVIPLQKDFLGGGMAHYLLNPFLWSWANFDGEHYLAIAKDGYLPLTYFFFPLYPILIRFITSFFGNDIFNYLISGLFISHLGFLIGLLGLYKLIKLDYEDKISKLSLILIIIFPTSFYFGSVYTESIFFALVVWSFFFARKRNWLIAGIIAAFATATRIVGLALVLALLVEWWQYSKETRNKFKTLLSLASVLLSFLGIGLYLYFLYLKTGDPVNFLNSVSVFGPQRSSDFILLPQVFYRYIFKILPNLDYSNLIGFFTPSLEFIVGLLFTCLAIMSFFRLRLSYSIYLILGFLIPTLSGSFSSIPRYVLVLFPGFILGALYLVNHRAIKNIVFLILVILLIICTSLFTRGFWIS